MADAELLFNGDWQADALRLVNPGNWYIGVQSPATKKVYALLPDPTGTGIVKVGGTGTFAITNPDTAEVETFRATDLVIYQAATALPQAPVEPTR